MSADFTQSLLNRSQPSTGQTSESPLLATIYRGCGWISVAGSLICIGVALLSGGYSQIMAGIYAALCVVWALFAFGMAEVIDLIAEIDANTRRERNDEIVSILRRIEAHLADRQATPVESSTQGKITWVPRP